MATLYLDRKGLEVRADGPALALYEGDERLRTVPLALIERVVFRADTRMSSHVLGAIADAGASAIVLGARSSRRVALVLGAPHNDARIRLEQYRRSGDAVFRLAWSRHLVRAKLRAQLRLLGRALKTRPDERRSLTEARESLQGAVARVSAANEVSSLDALRGMEGAAQAAYFRAFAVLFPETLGFSRRNRRPPRDPVNACLSLGYTLVHCEAVRAAYAAGLDPFIGFFHDLAFGRESLACDLVEPLRASVDALVWDLFRTRVLRAEHFREERGACRLDKAGRAHFYKHFEAWLRPASRQLRRYARLLVRALMADAQQWPDAKDPEETQ